MIRKGPTWPRNGVAAAKRADAAAATVAAACSARSGPKGGYLKPDARVAGPASTQSRASSRDCPAELPHRPVARERREPRRHERVMKCHSPQRMVTSGSKRSGVQPFTARSGRDPP
eukprot:scaffold105430_cov57-Phaeocystis_antarctica.AAC.3